MENRRIETQIAFPTKETDKYVMTLSVLGLEKLMSTSFISCEICPFTDVCDTRDCELEGKINKGDKLVINVV